MHSRQRGTCVFLRMSAVQLPGGLPLVIPQALKFSAESGVSM